MNVSCDNPDCDCYDDGPDVCGPCEFEEWAGEDLLAAYSALIDAVKTTSEVVRVRAICHALEHLEEVLDILYGDD